MQEPHATARQVSGRSADLAQETFGGFDVEAAAAAQHPACSRLPQQADAAGVSTLVGRRRRPFHPERLYHALEDLVCAAASRGCFWLPRPLRVVWSPRMSEERAGVPEGV